MTNTTKTINRFSTLIKEQLEIWLTMNSRKDHTKRIERQKLLRTLYEELFHETDFFTFANSNKEWKKEFGNVQVSFEMPDFNSKGIPFLEGSPLNLQCILQTENEDYLLIVPLHRHNIEMYIYGILSTSTLPSLLSNLDGCLIARQVNNVNTYSWMLLKEDFLDKLYPEEYWWVNQLVEACLLAFEDINILHLQQTIMSGKILFSIKELELLKIWSHFYVYAFYSEGKELLMNSLFVSFDNFYQWANMTGYVNGKYLRLKSPTGGFTPTNCEWVDKPKEREKWFVENNNEDITDKTIVEIDGQSSPIKDWSSKLNIQIDVLIARKKWGWNDSKLSLPIREKAFVQSHYTNQIYTINGEKRTLKEWSTISGIPLSVLIGRIYIGWTEEILLSPYKKGAYVKRKK